MKIKHKARYVASSICIWLVGMFALPLAIADSPDRGVQPLQPISDIALNADDTLAGRLVAADGKPLAGRMVALMQGMSTLKTVNTDSQGGFQFGAVPAGNLALRSGDYSQHMRVWTADSAPPIAQTQATLVCGPTVRGQFGNTIGGFVMPSIHPVQYLRNPATIGGIIGLAIAAPLAIHNPIPPVPATLVYSPSLSYLPQYE